MLLSLSLIVQSPAEYFLPLLFQMVLRNKPTRQQVNNEFHFKQLFSKSGFNGPATHSSPFSDTVVGKKYSLRPEFVFYVNVDVLKFTANVLRSLIVVC